MQHNKLAYVEISKPSYGICLNAEKTSSEVLRIALKNKSSYLFWLNYQNKLFIATEFR